LPQWFFTSDLHGQGSLYEQLVAVVAAHRPEAVLIGGDLCQHALGEGGVGHQRLFLQGTLVEFARRLREGSPGTTLMLLMGNDDWAANMSCLEAHDGELWHVLHDRVVRVAGVAVAGLSWVPITPFTIKDWERWDDGDPESPARLDGWSSRGGALERCHFDPESRTPTIADALDGLAARTNAAETLFVLHSPPRGTRCDVIHSGQHVGSRAIRAFVEARQPPLVLAGHIHESARTSASYRDVVGRTIVVNPGQFGTSRLCGVWFDPADPGATLRHTVLDG
jgi:Icc-related predicted phosphoesterase